MDRCYLCDRHFVNANWRRNDIGTMLLRHLMDQVPVGCFAICGTVNEYEIKMLEEQHWILSSQRNFRQIHSILLFQMLTVSNSPGML